jgi:hypothetical protein
MQEKEGDGRLPVEFFAGIALDETGGHGDFAGHYGAL